METKEPEYYMRLAIEEAEKGRGFTNPNPMVGAVIVKDGRIISKDYHHRCGEYHAERNAILNCREDMTGATLYVTLEPCCHYGKTPPCTQIILESGITEVYVGSTDPNPLVGGKGIAILQEHGIRVVTGICEKECLALNRIFFHYIQKKRPYVIMKYAMTADGKIATVTGASKWITGEAAREQVQKTRHACMGIMVGVGTVLADDPALTCRIPGGKNPVRIICDTTLQTPLSSQIVQTAGEVPTILAAGSPAAAEKREAYEAYGCQVLEVPVKEGHLDLQCLMQRLGEMEIDSILLEGGAMLNAGALKAGIVTAVQLYLAPKLFGGAAAKSPVGGEGVALPADAYRLKSPQIMQIGEDIRIEWEVETCSQGS